MNFNKIRRLCCVAALISLFGCDDGASIVSNATDTSALDQFSDRVLIESSVSPTAGRARGLYQPEIGVSWQAQLLGTLNTSYEAEIYVLDLFDTPVETIRAIQADGRRAICFFNAGVVEGWRPDAHRFTAANTGSPRSGWAQQHWIDIRSPNVHNIMRDRLTLAQQKGCDGVAPATVDSYMRDTSFPLNYNHGLMYNRGFVYEAHARGLSIGLVNNRAQIPDLVDDFDFALGDLCYQLGDCAPLAAFINSGKPVLNAEYRPLLLENNAGARAFCRNSNIRRFSTLILPSHLNDEYRYDCRNNSRTVNVQLAQGSTSSTQSQATTQTPQQNTATQADSDGYRLVFSEDFRDYSIDTSNWNSSYRWGSDWIINGEQQYYVDQLNNQDFGYSPFVLDGEHLTIRAVRTPDWLRSHANNQPYLSGALTTFNKFSIRSGYVEMRAILPKGRGLWSAFWMLHENENGIRPEIDVVEYLGHQPNVVYNTYHWYDRGNGRSSPSMEAWGPDYSAGFHTYGVRWEPGLIEWYVDGELRSSLPSSAVTDEPMYLLVNLAVGGWWPGSPNNSTEFPAAMTIDYIRAWQR